MNEHTGGPFIYSALGGITCAVCAPAFMAAEEIELFAYLRLGATKDGNKWRVFDKSKLEFLQPTLATPHQVEAPRPAHARPPPRYRKAVSQPPRGHAIPYAQASGANRQ